MSTYKPMMSGREVVKRKRWQEQVYEDLTNIKKKQTIKKLGYDLTVLPGVFAPLWGDSILLARVLKKEIETTSTILDLGTGSGIQGIVAAEKAASVLSVDINPTAVKCTKLNVKKLKLDKIIKVKKSDLFSDVSGKFDFIIYNPPFRWFRPRDTLERGELDHNYASLRKFFKQAKKYLNKDGKIIFVFSESGDIKYLKHLIRDKKYKYKTLAKKKINNWGYFVFEIKSI